MLVFFAAAAGAGVISAGLFRLADGLAFFTAVRAARSTGDFRLLFALDFFIGAQNHGQNPCDCALLNGGGHFVEHIKTFHAECHNRVLLTVRTQINAAFEFFHRVDVIHPAQIDILQQDFAFQFLHNRVAVFF